MKLTKQQALKKIEELQAYIKGQESKKQWRAKVGEKYYHVDAQGDIEWDFEENHSIDNYLYTTGNYFQTKEEAEAYKERQLAIGRVTHAILEANGDWEVDWSDDEQEKYHIEYDPHEGHFYNEYNYSIQINTLLPHIKDQETTKQIIKDHKEDLLLIFGVK